MKLLLPFLMALLCLQCSKKEADSSDAHKTILILSVTKETKPVPDASVILYRSFSNLKEDTNRVMTVTTDKDGMAKITDISKEMFYVRAFKDCSNNGIDIPIKADMTDAIEGQSKVIGFSIQARGVIQIVNNGHNDYLLDASSGITSASISEQSIYEIKDQLEGEYTLHFTKIANEYPIPKFTYTINVTCGETNTITLP